MKLSFSGSSVYEALQKHISILLALCLVVVILLEALVFKRSADLVLRVKNQIPNFQTRIIRVNLQQYTEIEKLIEESDRYNPVGAPVLDPFGLPPQT